MLARRIGVGLVGETKLFDRRSFVIIWRNAPKMVKACLLHTIGDFQQNGVSQSPSTPIDTTITLSIGTDILPQRDSTRCNNVTSHIGSQQPSHRL